MAVYQNLVLSQVSQSIANNTSQVRVLWESTQTGGSHNDISRTAHYYISINNGEAIQYDVDYTLPSASTRTILDTTITVPHNNDGTGAVKVTTWMDTRISAGVVEKSQTLSLDKIPRATTPEVNEMIMGTPTTITLNPASNDFTHTLCYRLGSMIRKVIVSKTSARSITWTPPKDLAKQLTSAATGTIHIYCITYNGDTELGSIDVPVYITVSSDTVPTLSVSLSDTTEYSETYGWVQNKSSLKVEAAAAGIMGSRIVSTQLTINGKDANIDSEHTLPVSGAIPVIVKTTDSRGRTATYTSTITVLAYSKPTIDNLSYTRGTYSNGNWSENSSGEDIKISFSLGMNLTQNKGNITVKLDGEPKQVLNTQSSGAKTVYITGAGTDTTRKITIEVIDALQSTSSKEIIISTVEVPLNINFQLPGVCFGGVAEKKKTVQIKWPIELKRNLSGQYLIGTWLQTTATADLGDAPNRVPVLDDAGWLYYRTLAELKSDLCADYITEQGTTGVWTWRKWASGLAELWGTFSATSLAVNTAWGSVYYGTWMGLAANKAGRKYPFAFVDTPVVMATPYSPTTDFWLLTDSANNTGTPQTYAPAYACVLPGSTTINNPQIHYYVTGKYK